MKLKRRISKKYNPNRLVALIDMDVLCYAIGFAAQSNEHLLTPRDKRYIPVVFDKKKDLNKWVKERGIIDYEVVTTIIPDPVENALHSVKVFINSILEATGASSYKGYLTGGGNFRELVAVTLPYKGNREGMVKPIHFQAIRDYLINHWNAEVIEGMEADDALAIEQTNHFKACYSHKDIQTVICSIDKDLRMVPGNHYNWNKERRDFVTEEEGMVSFFKQLLTGDSTDNIQGLRGVGPKTADKLLDSLNLKEMLSTVGLEYAIREEDPEARLREDGALLWMLRKEGEYFDLDRMIRSLAERE